MTERSRHWIAAIPPRSEGRGELARSDFELILGCYTLEERTDHQNKVMVGRNPPPDRAGVTNDLCTGSLTSLCS